MQLRNRNVNFPVKDFGLHFCKLCKLCLEFKVIYTLIVNLFLIFDTFSFRFPTLSPPDEDLDSFDFNPVLPFVTFQSSLTPIVDPICNFIEIYECKRVRVNLTRLQNEDILLFPDGAIMERMKTENGKNLWTIVNVLMILWIYMTQMHIWLKSW